MADLKLTQLTAAASADASDILYVVTNPGGSPVSQKITKANLLANITTLGTIATGVWQGTKIGLAYGGTNVDCSAITDGQILIGKTSDHTLNLATITGTANQITVTNGGGTITLSTPQSINTSSAVTFATVNALTLSALATGFSIAGGTTSKTLTVDETVSISAKAPIASPTFTGTVSGITATMVGLGNCDNTSDANKPISTATQTALDLKAPIASPTFTGTVSGITAVMVGAAAIASPTFTGKVTVAASAAGSAGLNMPHGSAPTSPADGDIWTTTAGVYAMVNSTIVGPFGQVGSGSSFDTIGSGTNTTSTLTLGAGGTLTFTSTGVVNANQFNGNTVIAAVDIDAAIARLASPTFTGTVSGITATMVGLGSVTNDAQITSANFPSSSVDSEIAVFNSTSGKSIKRATGTGFAYTTSGVLSNISTSVLSVDTSTAGIGVGKTAPTACFHAARSDGLYQYKIERSGGTDPKIYGIAISDAAGAPSLALYDVSAGTATRLQIDTSGKIGNLAGTLSYNLHISGSAGKTTGETWTSISDARLKIVKSEIKGTGLNIISQLKPVIYEWNELKKTNFGDDDNKNFYGFLAQELEKVIPEFITTDNNGYKWTNMSGFNAILTAAIQEQQDQIDNLKKQLKNK